MLAEAAGETAFPDGISEIIFPPVIFCFMTQAESNLKKKFTREATDEKSAFRVAEYL